MQSLSGPLPNDFQQTSKHPLQLLLNASNDDMTIPTIVESEKVGFGGGGDSFFYAAYQIRGLRELAVSTYPCSLLLPFPPDDLLFAGLSGSVHLSELIYSR